MSVYLPITIDLADLADFEFRKNLIVFFKNSATIATDTLFFALCPSTSQCSKIICDINFW